MGKLYNVRLTPDQIARISLLVGFEIVDDHDLEIAIRILLDNM